MLSHSVTEKKQKKKNQATEKNKWIDTGSHQIVIR